MPYDKEELLKLNVQEKMMLAEELWDSIDEELLPVSVELQQIAKERYEEHLSNPDAIIPLDELKKKIQEKYGF